MTAIRYQDEMIGPTVRPYPGAIFPGFPLVHKYVWFHVVRVCRQLLADEGIDTTGWPAHSRDLNPIRTALGQFIPR